MRLRKLSRRRFLALSMVGAPVLAVADAKWVEPTWVKVRRVRLGTGQPTHRLVHFTDVHHRGDRAFLVSVVNKINALSPDLVCFTGDLIDEQEHLAEALEILSGIEAPLYGVPGNHDYWSKAAFSEFEKGFAATGGGWLLDRQVVTRDGKLTLFGASSASFKQPTFKINPATRNIFLMHYPAWVEKLQGQKFDLILAGHSHGGQVRIPFYGALIVPYAVEQYEMGLFQTAAGPLYVNPGLGWFAVPLRFNCRPELTVFEI